MPRFDRYDVLMKVLEIVELDTSPAPVALPEEDKRKVINIIHNIEGSMLLQGVLCQEVSVQVGDRFEHVSQSIIATRGSIATGIIKVRAAREYDIASALEELDKAIREAPASELSENSKLEAFQHLDELIKQTAAPNRIKAILKTVGNGLWEAIKNVDSISKTVTAVWPVIQRLWT